ncbi:hypothetical protein F5887DRAFT_1085236 [Amanita rubescens]|nr:hypothetical protein F5887DRAFT_1085236 [Amanita rubescens]
MPRTPTKSTSGSRISAAVPYTTPSPSPSPRRVAGRKSQLATAIQAEPILVPATPSVTQLLDQTRETTDEWYRFKRTKNGYANYVKNGKQWLGEWATEDRTDDDSEEGSMRVHLAQAFNTIRFLGVKATSGDIILIQRPGKGIQSSSPDFKTYYESLKNRENRTGTVIQALPMFPKDFKVIMDYLDGKEGSDKVSVTRRLYFKAFATTAFALWTRNEELINLRFGNVKLCQESATGKLYMNSSLFFEKQIRTQTKTYFIPQNTSEPEIDCYTHLLNWVSYQQGLIARPLGVDDLIFPAIASTGQIKFGVPTSRSGFEAIMDDIVQKSGVMQGRNGKFTTHCFRRGGAQYRFMYAPRKWSLKAVKWWGGWSSNDNVNTIMRYLLEELTAYEEGFSDILMEDRASERHESFMSAPDPLATPTKKDLFTFSESIIQNLRASSMYMLALLQDQVICQVPGCDSCHTTTSYWYRKVTYLHIIPS